MLSKSTLSAALILLLLVTPLARAKDGDIRHILSHDRTKVVTDPSKGFNAYRSWGVFPSRDTEYRKVELYVTYQCPDSQHCGEWDYIDGIFLRRIGGSAAPSQNLEIARMISPYGSRFGSTWKFTWHVDLTDFALLLRDSVEVEFNHGGYEKNDDRGWLITLDFQVTEGKPARECLGMDTLWQGMIPFGDTAKPISRSLSPISFTDRFGADEVRLRILQTGHGMDDSANCAEFCDKYRKVLLDDSLVDQRQIWRRCGTNPLYPQAGTWIYNRANWCPGSIVAPDCYDLSIKPKSTHILRMEMEPYINPNHPTANYQLSSYLFYYKEPWAANDASLEEIVAPGVEDEYSRQNPICSNPIIIIRNNGMRPLNSLTVKYGAIGEKEQSYFWNGNLAPQKSDTVTLPGLVSLKAGEQKFSVTMESPNGSKDEYQLDNSGSSVVTLPPTYPAQFILALHTNHDSTQTGYAITDQTGTVVRERKPGSLNANTTYYDTLKLAGGCYKLAVVDTAGDGLDFWANPEGGYGYVRLLDSHGRLMKGFGADFGSEIEQWFTVSENAPPTVSSDTLPLVSPFPARNKGTFTVEIFQNEPADLSLRVVTEDSSKTVFEQSYPRYKEGFLPVDISSQPDGIYYLKASVPERTVTRRIRVKHQD